MSKINDNMAHVIEQCIDNALKKLFSHDFAYPEYFDTKRAAAYLGLSKQRLEIWRVSGDGPPYTKLAQAVRYKRSDLDVFMAKHLRNNTTEGGANV